MNAIINNKNRSIIGDLNVEFEEIGNTSFCEEDLRSDKLLSRSANSFSLSIYSLKWMALPPSFLDMYIKLSAIMIAERNGRS